MKTHRFDLLSFIAGLIITLIGLAFLIPSDVSGIVDFVTGAGAWFWPVVLIAIGVGVLVPLAGGRAGETSQADGDDEDADV